MRRLNFPHSNLRVHAIELLYDITVFENDDHYKNTLKQADNDRMTIYKQKIVILVQNHVQNLYVLNLI